MVRHNVAVVTGIPAPYREPVFVNLAERENINLKVFYCAKGHGNVAWSDEERKRFADHYDHEFLDNATPKRFQRLPMLGYTNLGITARLKAFDPSYVIVYGYNQWTHWLTFRYCKKHGIPFALRSDSNGRIDESMTLQSRWRRRVLRKVVRDCSAVLPVGTANREYWERYGATPSQVHMAPYAIDNDRVRSLTADRSLRNSTAVRFIYAGRLISRKGVDLLIQAFNQICTQTDARLEIVGDGPERERLVGMQSPQARENTCWHGRLPNDEVFQRFAQSDVFVLPSLYEPWGLVVNEAMAAGLPVIADHRCGAAIDLVEDGVTGWKMTTPSVEGLVTAMSHFSNDPEACVRMGVEAQAKVQQWSFDRTVDGFVAAIQAAAKDQGKPSANTKTASAAAVS